MMRNMAMLLYTPNANLRFTDNHTGVRFGVAFLLPQFPIGFRAVSGFQLRFAGVTVVAQALQVIRVVIVAIGDVVDLGGLDCVAQSARRITP